MINDLQKFTICSIVWCISVIKLHGRTFSVKYKKKYTLFKVKIEKLNSIKEHML
jgi:hypothetical protein